MNNDGTDKLQLTNDPSSTRYPSWSPDGTRIAFVSQRDGNNEVYVMDADGSNQIRLTNESQDDIQPSWSPDGENIVFVSSRNGSPDVFTMRADGTGQQGLTQNANAGYPSWAPDGTKILFTSFAGASVVMIMDPDGTNQQAMTTGFDLYPAWSPIGIP
jgi:Tol biopolymer transport system component